MACEWERSYNAMHCPCLYILSAWMHFLFTTTILMKKIISLSIHLLSIALFRNSPLTDSRIWLYTSEIHVHIFRDEKACIMTSRYFTLAKNDFMSDWKLLDAVNGNDGSSYPFRTEKKKKEMHTHHVRNTYNTLGMHVIEVKGTSHLLFSWEIYHKISMTWQNVIAGGKPLFQNVLVHIAYAVNPLMTGSVIWLRHYTIFNLGEISGFLGIFRRLNHSCVLLKDFFFFFLKDFFLTWAVKKLCFQKSHDEVQRNGLCKCR